MNKEYWLFAPLSFLNQVGESRGIYAVYSESHGKVKRKDYEYRWGFVSDIAESLYYKKNPVYILDNLHWKIYFSSKKAKENFKKRWGVTEETFKSDLEEYSTEKVGLRFETFYSPIGREVISCMVFSDNIYNNCVIFLAKAQIFEKIEELVREKIEYGDLLSVIRLRDLAITRYTERIEQILNDECS